MDAPFLIAFVVLLLVLWLVRSHLRSNTRARLARQSRRNLRNRASDNTLAGRVFGKAQSSTRRGEILQSMATRVAEPGFSPYAERGDSVATAQDSSMYFADSQASTSPVSGHSPGNELALLRARLRERDDIIRRLQQRIEDEAARSSKFPIHESRGSSATEVFGQATRRVAQSEVHSATQSTSQHLRQRSGNTDAAPSPDSASSAWSGDGKYAGEDKSNDEKRVKGSNEQEQHEQWRNQHAMQEVEKLRKTLFERSREFELLQRNYAKSEQTLEKFRTGAQCAAMLEQQLLAARAESGQHKKELDRLQAIVTDPQSATDARLAAGDNGHDSVEKLSSSARQTNQKRKAQLVDELDLAETEAAQLQQNALELRRIRSELASVKLDKSNALSRIAELEVRVREQQKALDQTHTNSSESGTSTTTKPREPLKPLFTAPAQKDNLKKIKGIGPVLEQTLNELGVTTFRQLANFSAEDVDKVSEVIGAFPGRIERDDWIGKARRLMTSQTDLV